LNDHRELLEWLINEERKRIVPRPPSPPAERPTIHYTELQDLPAGTPGATEWNYYRSQIALLLAEGHEGRWVLIKGQEIIGIWDTRQEAAAVWAQRFLREDVLIQQILTRGPIIRGPIWLRLWAS
jgi:hypothetical protein